MMPVIKNNGINVIEISSLKPISFECALSLIPVEIRVSGIEIIYLDLDGTFKDFIFTIDKLDIEEEDWFDFINWSVPNN